jgi:N,N'-diacetylchitobiose non-reducing end deacetylase
VRKRLIRVTKVVGFAFAILFAAFLLFVYTRPVHVSAARPTQDNTRLREDLFKSKKVLFVSAHPDDIEFYAAGLVHLLRERGVEVVYAIGTRGGKGRTGRAKARLEGRRTHDQLDAARIIGGARVVFYDYPDKALPSHVSAFANDLRALIEREKPDVVFSWDPDYIYNPHPDHVAAAQAAEIAIDATGARACFYGTREPNLWIGYGEDVFRLKLRSLKAHRTETPWPYFLLGKRFLTRKSVGEGAKIGTKYAEVFRCSD